MEITSPTPRKIIQGLWPHFHFIGFGLTLYSRGNRELSHRADGEKTDQLQSSSYYSSGENRSIDEKEYAVLMQSEWRFYR